MPNTETPGQYVRVATDAGEALVRRASVLAIAQLDSIIFDVDGVLIDVSDSIRLVHAFTAERYFREVGWSNGGELITPSDVDSFKLAGGFNSDWDLAYSWMLLCLFKSERHDSTDGRALRAADPTIEDFTAELAKRGGGLGTAVALVRELCRPEEWTAIQARWDRPGLQRLFIEIYSGDLCSEIYGFEPEIVKGPGLICKDRAILDPRLIPSSVRCGIATGRTGGETVVGLRLMGWSDLFPPEAVVSEDHGFHKPDPRVLQLAVERLAAERPMYVGDTPDDLMTVRRYNEIGADLPRAESSGIVACMVLTGPRSPDVKERFVRQQADLIADNVNAALMAADRCMGGTLCLAGKQT